MKIKYSDFQSAFVGNLDRVMVYGEEVSPRGMLTKELLMHSFGVWNPDRRALVSAARAGNPIAQVAEALWVLSGRSDLSWLEEYIPQCRKWSDDGETWRAGYGPRLRKWGGAGHKPPLYMPPHWNVSIDQIYAVYIKLQQDPDTRQAVISLWDPAEDWVEDSKDYPCNNWLHFIIRDDKLHLNVAIRSNDAVYGFSHADFFTWSVLQQALASWLGISIGTMQWNATSFHIYERHFDKAREIVTEYNPTLAEFYTHFHPTTVTQSYDTWHHNIAHIMQMEHYLRNGISVELMKAMDVLEDGEAYTEFTTISMFMIWLWYAVKASDNVHEIANVLRQFCDTDMGVSTMHWVLKKRPDVTAHVEDTKAYQFLEYVGFVS